MKPTFLATFLGASALSLGLTILPVTAQTTAPSDTAPTTTTAPVDSAPTVNTTEPNTVSTTETSDDRDFDWGWLGLLGLLGLAGLARKNDEPVARYREPDEVSSPSSRY